ncbi:MAG: glycosyltransferase family 4 protein [Flavobacterium sp.]|uniref:glycosyltransferase family 4 protein n=1 Tax=Flavobacterium sp. TaxID=239 RepID=UPI00326720F1
MKTVLIAHNYSKNSFAIMSYNLAHYLADLGYRVIFISHKPYFEKKEIVKKEKGEIIIYSWPTKKRPTSIKDFIWYAKIYLKYKPEVIIGHFVGSNITAIVSKTLSFGKVKTLVYYHTLYNQIVSDSRGESIKQKILNIRKKWYYYFVCDIVVCPSAMAKKDLLNYFSAKNGVVVLNPMADRFVSKIPISNENIIISYLGRLDISKGVFDLIEAFNSYKEKKMNSKIILNIAGSGSQESEIVEIIKDNSSVIFLGALSYEKIDDYLNKSHFTIISSKFDNLPTVGLESLMNKTPLLISNSTGLTNYLTDENDCFKFDSNLDSLIKVFEKVEANFNSHQVMSENARKTYEEKFTLSDYCANMLELIK